MPPRKRANRDTTNPGNGWTCATCGSHHDDLPLCFGAEAPWDSLVPESEFERRVALTQDQCVVDERVFFIRGHVEIPIIGTDEYFVWSVWCSLSEKSFRHMTERWTDPEREGDGYFGWLSTALPAYPSTLNIETNVCSRAVGVVPLVEVQERDHPLYYEQRDGMSRERHHQIVHQVLHSND